MEYYKQYLYFSNDLNKKGDQGIFSFQTWIILERQKNHLTGNWKAETSIKIGYFHGLWDSRWK